MCTFVRIISGNITPTTQQSQQLCSCDLMDLLCWLFMAYDLRFMCNLFLVCLACLDSAMDRGLWALGHYWFCFGFWFVFVRFCFLVCVCVCYIMFKAGVVSHSPTPPHISSYYYFPISDCNHTERHIRCIEHASLC